ncbi:MAG: amino acid permease, partial [Caldilineaceae bacterium]|nr:amino acid permease [Caldilineaceae bacterium]
AANTGYQDFPRLSSFLAHDGFLPRWLQNRGSRLVFSSGIIVLAVLASTIVIIFDADEIAMLPLYALGVMLCFTLSQAGMVHLMTRISTLKPGETLKTHATEVHYEAGWWWKRALNFVGAITTGAVFIVLVVTKFTEGAWIVVVVIPILVIWLRSIHKHYEAVARSLSLQDAENIDLIDIANVAIVPIADIHRGALRALKYAGRLAQDVRAVSIVTSPEQEERIQRRWANFPDATEGIKLALIDYDFRDILSPLIEYIEHVSEVEYPDALITVVIPEFVPEFIPANLLHNQTANILRMRLLGHENIVVIDIPYHIHGKEQDQEPKPQQEPWHTLN